jgi:hypothetical protein
MLPVTLEDMVRNVADVGRDTIVTHRSARGWLETFTFITNDNQLSICIVKRSLAGSNSLIIGLE